MLLTHYQDIIKAVNTSCSMLVIVVELSDYSSSCCSVVDLLY